MEFDNGEVLNGLNQRWTFLGANIMEWGCGLMTFMIISTFSQSPVRVMPYMLLGMVATTATMASLRKSFPDEERGIRNAFMTACGFPPPGIPAPSAIQPVWSAAPVDELDEESTYRRLGLDTFYPYRVRSLFEDGEFEEEE